MKLLFDVFLKATDNSSSINSIDSVPPVSQEESTILKLFELTTGLYTPKTPVALVDPQFISTKEVLSFDIYSGASFSIANTLYLASSSTKLLVSIAFFNIKKVSSSTLFLSDEGKDNQILPSSAL